MIKQSLYPKTTRYSSSKQRVTEKLDGSNLVLFNLSGIHIAQRNTIYTLEEGLHGHQGMYKGLSQWLKDNHESLNLHEGAAICTEWLGMGCIKYSQLNKRVYMFAKANVHNDDGDFVLYNINYYHENFKWPFISQEIPECVGLVPIILDTEESLDLDALYESYKSPDKVEGFIVITNNNILKYVRFKDGKPSEHRK